MKVALCSNLVSLSNVVPMFAREFIAAVVAGGWRDLSRLVSTAPFYQDFSDFFRPRRRLSGRPQAILAGLNLIHLSTNHHFQDSLVTTIRCNSKVGL